MCSAHESMHRSHALFSRELDEKDRQASIKFPKFANASGSLRATADPKAISSFTHV